MPFLCNKKYWMIGGIAFCVLLGVLLHFVYEWSGNNKLLGYVSAVNESTWEHLKLLFYPVVIFTAVEWFKCERSNNSFLLSRTLSLLVGMLWIVVAFYTLSGIIGKKDISVINIGIFVLGVIITFLLTELMIQSYFNPPQNSNIISAIVLFIMIVLFSVLTYNPLPIGLFKEP